MMQQLRHISVRRLVCGFMGLLLLNCSVDSPDTQPDHLKDPVSLNDQESIIEMFVEKVFRFDNVIAEHDDDDTESHSVKKTVSVDFFVLTMASDYKHIIPQTGSSPSWHTPSAHSCPSGEIHAPPPEA